MLSTYLRTIAFTVLTIFVMDNVVCTSPFRDALAPSSPFSKKDRPLASKSPEQLRELLRFGSYDSDDEATIGRLSAATELVHRNLGPTLLMGMVDLLEQGPLGEPVQVRSDHALLDYIFEASQGMSKDYDPVRMMATSLYNRLNNRFQEAFGITNKFGPEVLLREAVERGWLNPMNVAEYMEDPDDTLLAQGMLSVMMRRLGWEPPEWIWDDVHELLSAPIEAGRLVSRVDQMQAIEISTLLDNNVVPLILTLQSMQLTLEFASSIALTLSQLRQTARDMERAPFVVEMDFEENPKLTIAEVVHSADGRRAAQAFLDTAIELNGRLNDSLGTSTTPGVPLSTIPLPNEAVGGDLINLPTGVTITERLGYGSYMDAFRLGPYILKIPHRRLITTPPDGLGPSVDIQQDVLRGYVLAKQRLGSLGIGTTLVHGLRIPYDQLQDVDSKVLENLHMYRIDDVFYIPWAIVQDDAGQSLESEILALHNKTNLIIDPRGMDRAEVVKLLRWDFSESRGKKTFLEGRTDLYEGYWSPFENPITIKAFLPLLAEEVLADVALFKRLEEAKSAGIPGSQEAEARIREAASVLRQPSMLKRVERLRPQKYAKAKAAVGRIHRLFYNLWKLQLDLLENGIINTDVSIGDHGVLPGTDTVIPFDNGQFYSSMAEVRRYSKIPDHSSMTFESLLKFWKHRNAQHLDSFDPYLFTALYLEAALLYPEIVRATWLRRPRQDHPLSEANGLLISELTSQVDTAVGGMLTPEVAL